MNMNLVEKGTATSISKLEELIRFHIHMMLDSYDEVYVANHDWKHLDEPFLSNFLDQRKIYESRLMEIVSRGIKTGEIKDLQPQIVMLIILSAVRSLEFWQRHKKNISVQVLEDDMVNQLLKGLVK